MDMGLQDVIPNRSNNKDGRPRSVSMAYLDQDDGDKWDWRNKQEPNQQQRKIMLARLIRRSVEFVWKNHLYQFDNKVYRQLLGGAIGLRLTQVVARIIMNRWDQLFNNKMAKEGRWDMRMYKRYVDDANLAIRIRKQTLEEQAETARIKEEANKIKELADTIMPVTITMEVDMPSNHVGGKMPILDLECWVDKEGKIRHQFYRKPMATTKVMMARSAFGSGMKRAVMIQLAMRRMLNCSPSTKWQDKADFLSEFSLCMKEAGHTQRFRREIITRAVTSYQKITESGTYYRSRIQREIDNRGKVTTSRSNWFRKLGATTTVKIPSTTSDILANRVKEVLRKT